jgi:hypothetical protein
VVILKTDSPGNLATYTRYPPPLLFHPHWYAL